MMHNLVEYIKKHPIIVIAVIGLLILLYLLYSVLKKGGGSVAASPTIVPYAPAAAPGGTPAASQPTSVSTTTTTTTDTSSVYSPYSASSTSSVYSPTSSYSTMNTSSVVGPVTTTTDSHNQQNTYNNPAYGLQSLPTGFAGVAGVTAQPLISPVSPIPVPASAILPMQSAAQAVSTAKLPVTNLPAPNLAAQGILVGGVGGGGIPQYSNIPGLGVQAPTLGQPSYLSNFSTLPAGTPAAPLGGPMAGAQVGGY
jgi:hypothetical protein